MNTQVQISLEDWQKLIDIHETLTTLLLESVDLFEAVEHTSSIPRFSVKALELRNKLEPIAKLLFMEEEPFGIKKL